MTGKGQLFGLVFLAYTLLFGGCGSLGESEKAKGPKINEIKTAPVEQKKADLLKQIDHKHENPEAHFQLGQLYQADGLWSEAEWHYSIALGFDPAHWNAQAAMVKVLLDSGNTAKGELYAEIYMNQVVGSAGGSLELGKALEQQGLEEYALACYQQALHLAPNSAKINRQIGFYYLSKGKKEQARDYLSRSFQVDRNQPEVAGELGRLGIAIEIPRKTEEETEKPDKIME